MNGRDVAGEPRAPIFRGLDGVRTLAVILSHQYLWKQGWVGVQLFFVLSGYLITGILFRGSQAPLRAYLRTFYGRRVLRIFPLYYAYLALLGSSVALGALPTSVWERLSYAAVYLANHYVGDESGSRLLMHFWSLAVEEQFYLVWPFLIYFCPRRLLRGVLIALVLAGIPIRYAVSFYFALPGYTAVSHIDAFAIGAISALYPWRLSAPAARLGIVVLWGVGLLALRHDTALPQGPYGWGYIVGLSVINAASALTIGAIASGQFLAPWFEHPLMRYCGKISYGIYIFHFPVQALVERLLPTSHVLLRLVVQIALTTGVSAFSFTFFESRFLALKERWFASSGVAERQTRAAVAPAPT